MGTTLSWGNSKETATKKGKPLHSQIHVIPCPGHMSEKNEISFHKCRTAHRDWVEVHGYGAQVRKKASGWGSRDKAHRSGRLLV